MVLGLSVVFGITRIINFAHGEMMILASLLTITFYQYMHLNLLLLLPLLALVMFGAGYGFQKFFITHLTTKNEHVQFIGLSAFAMILLNLELLIFGSEARSLVVLGALDSLTFGPFLIDKIRLYGAVIAFTITIVLFWFFRHTATGTAIRACSDNSFAAKVIGLNDEKLYAISFGIAGAILALSGGLISLLIDIVPQLGPHLTLLSFVVVIMGGLNSMTGALAGGILLGISESYVAFYGQSSLKSFVSFGLLILILLLRPQGLLAERG